uniref:Guanylate cyclase domain-containing protein n=1 Tax=Spumella elongata TaxID=89044 RepID=A0A7S3MF79_9STRA|mmetsp:Transcript_62604/g.110489  ORF Transcript_62604/g.110489 Transcript_62604/m.110489 type:complete len:969 (+) Transcript_62604:3-2909(+)
MFMKWDSYDADGKHRNLMELQACFYEAQRILQTTGAYLRQFLVDDKGCVLIGCWGMPHLSYLDNSYRALSAAAQIKYELNKLGMNCSFGITTGDVYCGTVGSPLRQEYAAIGSVVNMSARLMCKADGGILIDDSTHARLPTNVLTSLNRLDPIKVKGREEPLQVYAYTASGAIHVREKIVEDHEISAVCKNTLLSVVDKMVSKDSKFAEPHPPAAEPNITNVKDRSGSVVATTIASGLVDLLSTRGSSRGGSLTRSSVFAAPTGTIMPVVLLQGKDGSGRTTVVRWLKKQAADRQLLVIGTKASKKDSTVDYMIWRKIFQQLMPKDLFLSNETQRSYVRALLKEVFPDQQKVGQLMGFPALKNYLGITCSYTEGTTTEAEVKASGWAPHNRKDKKKPTTGKDKLMPIVDTMHKIFAHLLNLQTSLVIIENIEHADEASLELLVDLTTKLSSRSVICLTALLVDDKNGGRNKNIFQSGMYGMRSVQVDAFHSTAWSKVYQGVIQKNKTTISVTLENYTPEEIDKMLAVALGIREVPLEISQLVQDFSGGSYFWVREILQFIKEHGPESFMSAIGENEKEVAEPKTPLSPGGRPTPTNKPTPSKHTSMRQLHGAKSFVNATSMRNINASVSVSAAIMNQAGAQRSQVKLDKLVLCRFENLHSHVQHVLRTASIIGMTFNSVVLYSIIPRHLKDQMSDCIKALLNQKWLYQDTDNESLYQFAHPHAHQIIYELTPSSERSNTHKAIAAHMEFTCGEDRAQFGAICFHYQHCDTDKALQYAVKAVAVMLESKNIFEYGDCLDLLFGCFSCCKNSFDVDVLMKLVNDTKNTIERLDLNHNKHAKRSFFDALFSCSSDTSAVTPEESIQHKASFSSEKMSDGSNRSDPSDLSDKNYELRAKLVFLEQLDKLNDRLCESYVELVDSDDAIEAKEWQRNVLGMSSKNNGNLLSRFARSLSEVYEVDDHLQRKNPRN